MLIINCNDVNNNNCVSKFIKNKIANDVQKINDNFIKNVFEFIVSLKNIVNLNVIFLILIIIEIEILIKLKKLKNEFFNYISKFICVRI